MGNSSKIIFFGDIIHYPKHNQSTFISLYLDTMRFFFKSISNRSATNKSVINKNALTRITPKWTLCLGSKNP